MSSIVYLFVFINFIKILNTCDIRCRIGYILDEKKCRCLNPNQSIDCPNLYCPDNTTPDYINCRCLERSTRIAPIFKRCGLICRPPKILSPDSCSCICEYMVSCIRPYYFDDDICDCVLRRDELRINIKDIDYPPPFPCYDPKSYYNEDTGLCECPPGIICPKPKFLNEETCLCEYKHEQIGSMISIKDLASPCILNCDDPPFLYPNYTTCKCECPIFNCSPGEIPNYQTCLCEYPRLTSSSSCHKICLDGSYLDKSLCLCIAYANHPSNNGCFKKCSPGYLLNRNLCQCLPITLRPDLRRLPR